jgi:alpha-glucosidase
VISLLLAATAPVAVASPDNSIVISVAPDGKSYSVTRTGEIMLRDAPLGLDMADQPDFSDLKLVDVQKQAVNRTIPLIATKASEAKDHYNGAVIRFREEGASERTLSIEARAYNEGVAFRYVLPGGKPVAIAGEKTGFRMTGDTRCEVTEFSSSHELAWNSVTIAALDRAKLYDLPMLCATSTGRNHFAFAQSGIEGYASSALKPVEGGVQVQLIPPRENPRLAVRSPDGLHSAWRVIMAGDRAGDLTDHRQSVAAGHGRLLLGEAGQGGMGLVVWPVDLRKTDHGALSPLHRFRGAIRLALFHDRRRLGV